MFIADFFECGKLTESEWTTLKEEVSCKSLFTSLQQYKACLEGVGFKVMVADDATGEWKAFTSDRHASFVGARDANVAVLGNDVYSGLEAFYATIKDLYSAGNLGGVQITAVKPLGW